MKTESITKFTKDIVPKALSLFPALTDSLPVLILYIFTVLWYTVLNRAETYEILQLELFWSFRKFFAGDPRLGIEIAGNVIMFMPFGFLLCGLFYKWNPARLTIPSALSSSSSTPNVQAKRKSGSSRLNLYGKWLLIPLLSLSFSLLIEILQLALVRGLAETDDLFTNTLGAVLGICTYEVFRKLSGARLFEAISDIIQKNTIRKKMIRKNPIFGTEKCTGDMFDTLCSIIRITFVLICLIVLIFNRKIYPLKENNLTRSFCFQIDEASTQGKELALRGFAFVYNRRQVPPRLVLRQTKAENTIHTDDRLRQSETEEMIVLEINYGAARPDVNEYFLCDYNYTNVGFTATGIVNPETEYEIMIGWTLGKLVSTGVYILGEDVHRVTYEETYYDEMTKAKEEAIPNLSTDFVKNGTLLVCRSDMHIWIYQHNGSLYWVADKGFHFEDDGTTKIQYQLWTTQPERLPTERLKKNHFWDSLSGYFEKYELSGDFGKYRVMRCKLPTEYSITSILTGYYKNGEWVWANSFRPIYFSF